MNMQTKVLILVKLKSTSPPTIISGFYTMGTMQAEYSSYDANN